jgi:hypothetical protein
MLRRILDYFRSRHTERGTGPVGHVVNRSPKHIPVRCACDAEIAGDPAEPTGLGDVPVTELMGICEGYWGFLARPARPEVRDSAEKAGAIVTEMLSKEFAERYDRYVRAVNELGNRGAEIRDWARRHLLHPDYEAREMAAWWIGQLGARGQLADVVGDVIEELRTLANRPVGGEPKERQAIDAAIIAIGKIGDPRGVSVLRGILSSTEWYHRDDTAWDAADALGRLVGERFADAPDRIRAAREWLATHPDIGQDTT